MSNLVRTTIKISDLEIGMTVELYGQLITVGKNDVYKNEFGIAFRGSSANKTITRVQFKVPTNLGTVLR